MSRVIVVGSGIAGLIAALRASERHEVVLVTKSRIGESNTTHAQGGIAAALFADDTVESHIADTLAAGAGLGDPEAVRVLCEEGPARVRDLIALGVNFDRENDELARGQEAAHSARRIVHAGGDATGLAIVSALVEAVRARGIAVLEHTMLLDLVMADDRVSGIDVLANGERRVLAADAVVLATGGAGQLFRHTTNPTVATGDGVAAALRAGAELADLEFYQFHPTALAIEGTPLISEAVRGEGAVLLDDAGRRFMLTLHPDAELAPRDVVARGIATTMAAQDGRPVLLDATTLGAHHLEERFPSITRACDAHGFDWRRTPIPVTPAAHYWMGGIRTDLHGRTSIAALFAVGEAAHTGVHGANRLASNSLLEGLVFGWRCAEALGSEWTSSRDSEPVPADGSRVVSRADIQNLMWDAAGLERTQDGLAEAARLLAAWTVVGDAEADHETRNLLDLARATVSAARARPHSVGAHFLRADAPTSSVSPTREPALR